MSDSSRPTTPDNKFTQLVLLNNLLLSSKSRAPEPHAPPLHELHELLQILENRAKGNIAVERPGLRDLDGESDKERNARALNRDLIRIREIRLAEDQEWRYAYLLVDHVDAGTRSFPVLNVTTFQGRDLSANEDERGSSTAHVAIRYPNGNSYDNGTYRCTIEHVPKVSRTLIEYVISRQLKRHAQDNKWTFTASVTRKGARSPKEKSYKYYPSLQLAANVGQKVGGALQGRTLSHMIFVKKQEKQDIGKKSTIKSTELTLNVEVQVRVNAKQGPSDETQKRSWLETVKEFYQSRGFDTKIYYRSAAGSVLGGEIHPDLASATDVVLCPRAEISLSASPKKWRESMNKEIVQQMKELLDKDELWERAKLD